MTRVSDSMIGAANGRMPMRNLQELSPMSLPHIETVSARVHDAWMASKRKAGIASRKSESGEELMVPYYQLSEQAKELDRGTVRAVYDAIALISGGRTK